MILGGLKFTSAFRNVPSGQTPRSCSRRRTRPGSTRHRFHPPGTTWVGRASTTKSLYPVSAFMMLQCFTVPLTLSSVYKKLTDNWLCAGGEYKGQKIFDSILQFDDDGKSQKWKEIGKLRHKRNAHATSIINFNKIEPYLGSCREWECSYHHLYISHNLMWLTTDMFLIWK